MLVRRSMVLFLLGLVFAGWCGDGWAAEPATTAEVNAIEAKLDGEPVPDLRFDGVPVGEVCEFIGDILALNLHLDRAALSRHGITRKTPVTLRARNRTPRQVLTQLIASLPTRADAPPLTLGVVGDVVLISDEPGLRLARDLFEQDRTKGADSATGKALDLVLPKTGFENRTLGSALDVLTDLTGVGIRVDYKSLGIAGISADAPVDFIVHELAARQTLRLILIEARSENAVADFTISPEGKLLVTTTVPAR